MIQSTLNDRVRDNSGRDDVTQILKMIVVDDITEEVFAQVICTDVAHVRTPESPLIKKAFELLAGQLEEATGETA